MADHLATAAGKLREMGYSRLVFVGIGRGAEAATAHVLAKGRGSLVWVVPSLSNKRLDALSEGGSGIAPAILDLVSSQSRGSGAADRRSRLQRAKVAGYQQQKVAMPARPVARDARQIAQRINGWLDANEIRK